MKQEKRAVHEKFYRKVVNSSNDSLKLENAELIRRACI